MLEYFRTFLYSPVWQLTALLFVGTAAVQGLVALWAATSRVHWFWRALAIWASVLLLVPIRAFEPALIFAVSGPLTVGLVALARFLCPQAAAVKSEPEPADGSSRFRFSLRDLFLLVLLVALIIVGLNSIHPRDEWREFAAYVACGLLLAGIVSLAYACIAGRWRWLSAILLAAVIAAAGLSMTSVCGSSPAARLWQPLWLMDGPQFSLHESAVFAFVHAELALVVLAFTFLFRASQVSHRSPGRAVARGCLATLAPALAVPLAVLYCLMLGLSPLPPPFSGDINHYNRILEIAERVQLVGSTADQAAQQELRELLDEAVVLLDAPNFVPCDPQADATRLAFELREADMQSWRALSRALAAASPVVMSPADEAQAIRLSLANIRLGVMLSRGGTIIDRLVGMMSGQNVGRQRISRMRGEVSPEQARKVIKALQPLVHEREDFAQTFARDEAMSERAFGWQGRLENVKHHLAGLDAAAEAAGGDAVRRGTTLENLLMADLAIRLFVHDHGQPPNRLGELVPEYLLEVPIDLFSQQPLLYRPDGGEFVLYSTGRDGRDDGGKFGNSRAYFTPGYDLDLDTFTRP